MSLKVQQSEMIAVFFVSKAKGTKQHDFKR
jgi:hypothetical protein